MTRWDILRAVAFVLLFLATIVLMFLSAQSWPAM